MLTEINTTNKQHTSSFLSSFPPSLSLVSHFFFLSSITIVIGQSFSRLCRLSLIIERLHRTVNRLLGILAQKIEKTFLFAREILPAVNFLFSTGRPPTFVDNPVKYVKNSTDRPPSCPLVENSKACQFLSFPCWRFTESYA